MAEAARKSADKKATDKDATQPAKSGQVEDNSKSRRKLLLVILAVLVVGVGAAAGGIFWMKSHASAKTSTAKEAPKKPETPAVFVPLEPPFVVNFQGDQSARFLQVAVQVMTHSTETAELLKQRDPVVRNDLLLLFGGQKVDDMSTREGKEKLQADALAAIRRIVTAAGGKGESVEALYFTSFVMQ